MVACNLYSSNNTTSRQPVPLRVDPVIPRIHPDESVGIVSTKRGDATARLRGAAGARYRVGVRLFGAALLAIATHGLPGQLGLPEDLRSMSVVKTLETAAFYELPEIISQIRGA